MAAQLNVKRAGIVDYENLNPKRRTPVPGHTLVLRLVDEVKRSTRESDVSPVALEDTLVMYRKLLELRVQVDRNSSYAKGVLEALESELRLRSHAEQLQASKTALDTLRRLRRQGTAVPEETAQRQQREIIHLEGKQPGLVTDLMRAENTLALIPGADPDHDPSPDPGPGPEAPAPPPPPFRSRTPGRPVGVLGPVRRTQPSSGRPPSWRYLIVGALVIILLGGFAIFRLTEDHSPTSNRADDETQQTNTTPPLVRQTTTPAVTTTTAPAPKTTT
ncbi:hypothetical protein [Streptomyces sp. NPDC056049]|uniref:hypothetical protein n=1 Tax=Streptomyces sp. NPDC056049 TaxID=3345693 RepID=UPI0035DF185E